MALTLSRGLGRLVKNICPPGRDSTKNRTLVAVSVAVFGQAGFRLRQLVRMTLYIPSVAQYTVQEYGGVE